MRLDEASVRYVRWLRVARNASPHTVRAYTSDLLALQRHAGGAAAVETLTSSVLFAFLEEQASAGFTASTVRRRACGIRGFCTWLAAEGLVEGNPWIGIRVSMRRGRTLPRALPQNDVARLLRHLVRSACVASDGVPTVRSDKSTETTTLLAVAVMVSTGIRAGELVTLRSDDVDLAGRRMRIQGKGAREREVYLPDAWLTGLTASYLSTRRTLGVVHPCLLFNRSGDALTTSALRSRVRNAAAGAGLRRSITPHMLRHTAATQLIEAGVDIRFVQRLLGHASLSTTELYTHVADNALRRVVTRADVLGAALGVATADN